MHNFLSSGIHDIRPQLVKTCPSETQFIHKQPWGPSVVWGQFFFHLRKKEHPQKTLFSKNSVLRRNVQGTSSKVRNYYSVIVLSVSLLSFIFSFSFAVIRSQEMAGSFYNIQELKLLKKQDRLTSEQNVMIVKTSVYLLKKQIKPGNRRSLFDPCSFLWYGTTDLFLLGLHLVICKIMALNR